LSASRDDSVSKEQIRQFSEEYNGKKLNHVLTNAAAKSGINAIAYNNEVPARAKHKFSLELDTMKVTHQKSSGRCWMFAGLNLIRERIAKKCNIEQFELSQNYLTFWDKFEKANYFLECILETLDEPVDGRLVTWLLQNAFVDGGQWDMFVNLVDKYGVIPKDAMPETHNSSNTGLMNQLVTVKLRKCAIELRNKSFGGDDPDSLRKNKDDMLCDIYALLCIFLGEPPTGFDFEYKDKDKVFHSDRGLTSDVFFSRYADLNLHDYVSIINAPTLDKPLNRTFTVRFLGNVKGGRDVFYLNTDVDTMKSVTLSQLKDNEPVWFGCDVGKMLDRELGVMDADLYRYDLALDMSFDLAKSERLDYRESFMTHAMVFTGVNLPDGKPNRWKVENSWGEEHGDKGYYVMTDKWFEEYMYQVVVNRKYLPEDMLKLLAQKPIILEPWDPMGSLA
jgi:bleomycin hydrolase